MSSKNIRMCFIKSLPIVTLLISCSLHFIICQDTALDEFFLKASKNIPRIERSSVSKGSNEDFENFFLKASKSVPRIGRRNEVQQERSVAEIPNSYIYAEKSENGPNLRTYPTFSEIAKLFENAPQAMASDEMISTGKADGNNENFPNEKEYRRFKRTSDYA